MNECTLNLHKLNFNNIFIIIATNIIQCTCYNNRIYSFLTSVVRVSGEQTCLLLTRASIIFLLLQDSNATVYNETIN